MYPNSWEEHNYTRQMNEAYNAADKKFSKMTEEQIGSSFNREDAPIVATGDADNSHTAEPTIKKIVLALLLLTACFIYSCNDEAHAGRLTASWYSEASCKREGTSGIMANGEKLDDRRFTCASWDFKFGTKVKVTNIDNGKKVVCEVSDRGPNKKLYRSGRVLDLSVATFSAIANLKEGVIPIKFEKVN